MKYKILLRLFAIFLLIMLTITMTGGRIREFTSPTVSIMPYREEIPNTAFINGSNRVYVLMERTSILGKEQYISSIELQKVSVNELTTQVNYEYNLNESIVIAADRPLRDNISVKTVAAYDATLIKSNYRDVIAVQIRMDSDPEQMIDNIKEFSPLVSDVWYQKEIFTNAFATLYVKANIGCSEILESQMRTLFGNATATNIFNLELIYRKLEYVLWMYFGIMLITLFIVSFRKLKEGCGKLISAFLRDKYKYYIKEIMKRNLTRIISVVIYGAVVCLLYYTFLYILPLPPIPAKYIPEKLIHIGRMVDSLSKSNRVLDKHGIVEIELLRQLNRTYMLLWIGLFALLGVIITVCVILKTRRARHQADVKKGKTNNE